MHNSLTNRLRHMKNPAARARVALAARTVWMVWAIIPLIVLADQLVKWTVKLNMQLYQCIELTDWMKIVFTENKGMAFGMQFIGTWGLALFRIVAICFFVSKLRHLLRHRHPAGFLVGLSLIVAGAAGNLIDNTFYGLIFTESTTQAVAQLTALGTGYGHVLTGRVVDMFYFPLFQWPQWMPLLGGGTFFGAIFNVADAAISCGTLYLLCMHSRRLMSLFDSELYATVMSEDAQRRLKAKSTQCQA